MSEEREEKILKAIVAIADAFEGLGTTADELKALVGEITEVGEVEHLTKGSNLLARVAKSEGKLTIMPVESLQIKAEDPALKNFLYPKVLDKMREKGRLDYSIEESNGLLQAIIITGPLNAKTIEELKNPIVWAFSKALDRDSEPKAETQKIDDEAVNEVKTKFSSDIAELLDFKIEGDYVVMKPRQFLGSENFAKVASIVRESGGEYISAGKDSRFKVPFEK